MMSGFRSTVWDPVMIIAQIVCLQSVFYAGLGVTLSIVDFIIGSAANLEQMFSTKLLHFSLYQGKGIMISHAFNALLGALGLWYVVKRTKQCWDFACTMYVFHLIVCWAYNGTFPTSLSWWLTMIISAVLMTVTGEVLCMRTELQVIPLNLGPKTDL